MAWPKPNRNEISLEQAIELVNGLPDFFDELVLTAQLSGRALEIARSLAHPAYDCFYLALAELRDVPMVTQDRRLLARLVGTPWAARVAGLLEVSTKI